MRSKALLPDKLLVVWPGGEARQQAEAFPVKEELFFSRREETMLGEYENCCAGLCSEMCFSGNAKIRRKSRIFGGGPAREGPAQRSRTQRSGEFVYAGAK